MKYWLGKLSILLCILSIGACQNESAGVVEAEAVESIITTKPEVRFGFSLDEFDIIQDVIQEGWTLSHLFAQLGIESHEIFQADVVSRDSIVGLKYIVAGRPFTAFIPKNDTSRRAHSIIYESSIVEYIQFNFKDSVHVIKHTKPVTVSRKNLTGEIAKNSNLTQTIHQDIQQIGLTGELSEAISGIFAWSIDFFKLQPGDQFKLVYTEKSVEDIPFGLDRIEAIWFKHRGGGHYAFYFENDSLEKVEGYYDEKGKEMKRPFLMSPVKFSRISSGYSANRLHPVQKRNKPHLGTDYAAPEGTPIFTTADGTIIEASRSQFNGNYVKVRHNETYQTQYLHMSKIENGIKPGIRVKQGQTIGYVGSTGLATGPHVCYRFWKNGKQVNHRAEKLPTTIPLKKELLPMYLEFIKPLKSELDRMK